MRLVRLFIICSTVTVVPFIICNADVSERRNEVFCLNLAPAGFQLGTYDTASHQAIIRL